MCEWSGMARCEWSEVAAGKGGRIVRWHGWCGGNVMRTQFGKGEG